jgi:hypothetical protein
LSELHAAGHVSDVPLHTKPDAHGGSPAYPCVAGPHVPLAGEPNAAAQVSQASVHAVLQQYPSTHAPFAQSVLPSAQA